MDYGDTSRPCSNTGDTFTGYYWPAEVVADIGEWIVEEIPKCPDCGRRMAYDGLCEFCIARQRIELRGRNHKRTPRSRVLPPVINRRMLPCNRVGREGKVMV